MKKKTKQLVASLVLGGAVVLGTAAIPVFFAGEASGSTGLVDPADLSPVPSQIQLTEVIHASKNPPCSPEPGGC